MAKTIDSLGDGLVAVRKRGERLAGRLGDAGGRVVDAAPDLAQHARDAFDDQLDHLLDQGQEVAAEVAEQLENARDFVVEHVHERPVAATLAALALGIFIGLAISGTRK